MVGAADSTFILGSISPCTHREQWELTINGLSVPVHDSGGFLAFVPIAPGTFVFRLEARPFGASHASLQHRQKNPFELDGGVAAACSVTVSVPMPLRSYGTDTLRLGPEYRPPTGDQMMRSGDRVEAWFQATPGCRAWFAIPGVVDSVPMAETDPRTQAYWGEAVFGLGGVPDTLLIKGIYSGYYDIPAGVRTDSTRLQYFLAPPDPVAIRARMLVTPRTPTLDSIFTGYLRMDSTAVLTDSSTWKLSINDPAFPFAVRFDDSVQIVRHAPGRGYLAIHQPKGVEAMAVGRSGDWYKLQLSRSQFGWIYDTSVVVLPKGIMPPVSYLRSIRTTSDSETVRIGFPLAGKHPFRVIADDRRTLRLHLFGVTTDTDWIRYDAKDSLIELASWSQPEEGLYEFKVTLTKDLWGYDTYYLGSTLHLQINRAPRDVKDLKGKVIVIDPGHSRDPGSIGPTRFTEAEANLGIALELRKQLQDAGATVVMTRVDTTHVALYDRPAIAKQTNADLFVSVHNNALPDGVNPFVNNGTSSYYYHPQSMGLARAIHTRMLERTELRDHGLYSGNLAVLRPTQYPAVLVECTFMLLPDQEAALKTDDFRRKAAEAIKDGIEDFLRSYEDGNR